MPGHLLAIPLLINLPSAIWAVGAWRWLRRPERLHAERPSVSVVVVGRNESEHVEACLTAALDSDYPADRFEIIFVDDHSGDGTLELARGIALLANGRIQVLAAPDEPAGWGPKKRALAHGVSSARGDYLLFSDADCTVPRGWMRAMVERFDERTGVVLGPSLPPRGGSWLQRFYWSERLLVNFTMMAAAGFGSVASACGNSIAYRRRAWDALPEFPYATLPAGDDDLVAQAIRARGWTVGFCAAPTAVVTDRRPPTVRRELQAAVRHQSTTKFYPLRWRALYAWTIIANLLILALVALACLRPDALILLLPSLLLKLLIEVRGARAVASRLGATVSIFELAACVLLLPCYLTVKPLLLLRPTFRWHERRHRADR